MRTRSLRHSFVYAFSGLGYVLWTQRNMRIHAAVAALVLATAAVLRLPLRDSAVLVLAIGIVAAAEMANTAVEALVDLASPQHHPLAGRAKDIAAGFVLVTAIAAAAAGLLILGPPMCDRVFATGPR
jgi:undecaprenol kinase